MKFRALPLLMATAGVAAGISIGCGSAGTDGQTVVSGVFSKGPVANATVTAYALNEDGSRGESLGSVNTDAQGAYSMAFEYQGAVELVGEGGSYSDEATGETVQLEAKYQFRTYIGEASGQTEAAVTPLTTVAAAYAYAKANKEQVQIQNAIGDADAAVANAFGMAGTDITATQPTDLTAAQTSAQGTSFGQSAMYGAVLAGMSQYAEDAVQPASDLPELVRTMAMDFGDGTFDGNADGTAVETTTQLSAQECHQNMATYINNFMSSDQNKSGFSNTDVDNARNTTGGP